MLDDAPVIYTDPFSDEVEIMDIEMINAYVPYASDLRLEEAAKVAAIRDDEAATNLILSIRGNECAYDKPCEQCIHSTCKLFAEGAGYDALAVEPPSLR